MAPPRPVVPAARRLADHARTHLAEAAGRAGFEALPGDAGDDAFGLRLRRRGLAYFVVGRAAREARREQLAAQLADALLRARTLAGARERPVAILAVPVLTDAMARSLHAYAARFAPGIDYLLLDATGRAERELPGLEGVRLAGEPAWTPAPAGRRRVDLFSDLGQWLLKVLLAPRFAPSAIAAPHGRFYSATALARAAHVSLPATTRFLHAATAEGFLGQRRVRTLVRLRPLLERWRAAVAARPVEERGARFVDAVADPARQLRSAVRALLARRDGAPPAESATVWSERAVARGERLCLGLSAAAAAHGIGGRAGDPAHVLVEQLSPDVLAALGLRPVRAGERAQVVVRRPRFPEATFRAATLAGGVPVADVVQCWLDVASGPDGGAGLAEELWRRGVAPGVEGAADDQGVSES